MEKEIKVAIQGGPASFHDEAARKYFAAEHVATVPCMSFRQLCEVLANNNSDYAIMAIENVIAGSILTNYILLQQFSLHIVGEMWLSIEQNLLALPGQELQDISTVVSHPVALMQCSNFLKQHPNLSPQETNDTAESARDIKERALMGVAAIASRQAALHYDMAILEENVADHNDNYTRFLVLSRAPETTTGNADKATLILELSYLGGSVSALTEQLHRLNIQVSLVELLPAPVTNLTHLVALEIIYDNPDKLQHAIEALKPLVKDLEVKGTYQHAAHPLGKEAKTSVTPIEK